MDKKLFKSPEELAAWKESESKEFVGQPGAARRILANLSNPERFPALLVYSWEDCPDDGLFLVDEFVYAEDMKP